MRLLFSDAEGGSLGKSGLTFQMLSAVAKVCDEKQAYPIPLRVILQVAFGPAMSHEKTLTRGQCGTKFTN